ncbi:MAG: PqqD family protein [Chloroflexi bacterium]|nr:PqqD family protein [Chloroflexota bacterium]MBI4507086.1 PqqD family protein [Chloroflexota bacterium]
MAVAHPRFSPHEAVTYARLGEEAILLHTATGVYFGLDTVGTQIWEAVAEGATQQEILDLLQATYEVEPARLHADLCAFLDLLVAKGLMRLVGESL